MQTSVDRPRFRQDLVAEPIEDGGAKFIDVMDPDSGTLFRFFEVEYSLACAMDGQRDVAGIVRWAEEELGLKANPNEIRTVIATLGDLGYLESGAAAAAAAATPTERPAAAVTKPAAPAKPAIEDDFVKPGVVAAKPAAASMPAADVELGQAGTARPGKADELPRAPELELGAPGTTAPAARAPVANTEDFGLGASGKQQVSDVSIDLADHTGIGVDDVKEAVRASQVMKAVEVPPELAAELEVTKQKKVEPADLEVTKQKKVEPAPEAKKPEPAAPKVEGPSQPKIEAKAEPKVEAKPEPKAEPKKPVEEKKPEPRASAPKPVVEEKKPAPPLPEKKGTSPVLIALLVLAILGAGGFVVYKYVLAKKSEPEKTSVQETPPPPPPPAPEPPPVETAKLAVEQPAPEEIKPTGAGQIAVLVPNDTEVKMGDPIAKLVGFKSLEADVATVEKTVAKAKADTAALEKEKAAAEAAGNKAGQTSAEKRLESATKTLTDAEAKLGTKKAALDKFLIKAPAAGKVTAVAKVKAKITPTDVVATLTRDPFLVATFKKADGATQDGHVRLGIKGSEQQLVCTVVQTAPEATKIACPKDAAPEGTEVTYVGIDQSAATPPPPADPIETHDTGSAAGSADTGSAGSATPEATGDEGSAKAEPKAEPEKKAKAPARPRPRPRPRPAQPAGEEGSAPAEAPAPAPEPAPAGSDGQ